MFFVYEKTINVASEYNYPTESIVKWFISNWDISNTFEDLGDTTTPQDIVNDIFWNPDCWYDDFVRDMDLEEDLVNNLPSDELASQIKDVTEDLLFKYYTEHWEDLTNEQGASNS